MPGSRAPAEPYTTSFEATIERIEGPEVVLDRTYFYPEGGGQPPDRGAIAGVAVRDVQTRGGEVVHELADVPDVSVGETVAGEVDRAFRTYCMRAHTASHALYGAGRRLLEDLGYGGFAITEEKVRVDFSTPTDVDDDTLAALERLVNRAVWESREVTWETRPKDEALAIDGVAFNTKTAEGITGEEVRIVEIEDWDLAACGGTHVSNTREIGPVTVLGRSNPGEGLTRVEMAVGPPGIERRVEEKRALLAASRVTGARFEELPGEVRRIREANAELESELADLRDRLVEFRIDELREEAIEKGEERWIVGAIEGLDANALGDRTRGLASEADVVALVGEDGRTFLAVASEGPDASGVVDAVTEEFGGGGGGSPDFAQAGGIDADPGEVVAFLRER